MSEIGSESYHKPVETERKYKVNAIPEILDQYQAERISQGYIVIGEDGTEVRLRDRDGAFSITVKSKGNLSRSEWETPITKDQFDTLWPTTEGRRVEKVRYSIPYDDAVIELDVYDGTLRGLVTAEVEFPNEFAAGLFVAPDWFGP